MSAHKKSTPTSTRRPHTDRRGVTSTRGHVTPPKGGERCWPHRAGGGPWTLRRSQSSQTQATCPPYVKASQEPDLRRQQCPGVGLSPGRGRLHLCCSSRGFPSQASRANHSAREERPAAQVRGSCVSCQVSPVPHVQPLDPFSKQHEEQSPVFLWHRHDADGRLALRERKYVRFCIISCLAELRTAWETRTV